MTQKRQIWRYLFLFLFLLSCIENAPMDSLDAQGPYAREINNLFWPILYVGYTIFGIVLVLLILGLFVFDDKTDKEPKNIEGSNLLEIIWTLVPIIIIVSIAIPTVKVTRDLLKTPENAIEIEVIGQQWWFNFYYTDQQISSPNLLVIPKNQDIRLKMTSKDVIHSFWVPKLNGKRYMVPNVDTYLNIKAEKEGLYWSQCGEFCGLSHAKMRARVLVVSNEEYKSWLLNQTLAYETNTNEGSSIYDGQLVFLNAGCTQCHEIKGFNESNEALLGPDLTHFASRPMFAGSSLKLTRENLESWLVDPPIVKPGSYMPKLKLTEIEINQLIDFLMELR